MKHDSRYDALQDIEGVSDSNTEVDEWDLEEREKVRSKGVWQKIKTWHWALDTILIMVIFTLLVERRWKEFECTRGHTYELVGDLTGFAPQCRSTPPSGIPFG
jgi:hypothetical protein